MGELKSPHWQISLYQCKAKYSEMSPGFPEAPLETHYPCAIYPIGMDKGKPHLTPWGGGSLLVWVITFNHSGMGDPTSSKATAGTALWILCPHKTSHYYKVKTPSGGFFSTTSEVPRTIFSVSPLYSKVYSFLSIHPFPFHLVSCKAVICINSSVILRKQLRCNVGENMGQRNGHREEHSIKCDCVPHAFMFSKIINLIIIVLSNPVF
jgi:hypothetical protein